MSEGKVLQQTLVLQGQGYFSFFPGESLVVPISYDGPSKEELAVIVNALRSGAGAVQAIGTVSSSLMEMLEERLLPLQEGREAFLITEHAACVRIARKVIPENRP